MAQSTSLVEFVRNYLKTGWRFGHKVGNYVSPHAAVCCSAGSEIAAKIEVTAQISGISIVIGAGISVGSGIYHVPRPDYSHDAECHACRTRRTSVFARLGRE